MSLFLTANHYAGLGDWLAGTAAPGTTPPRPGTSIPVIANATFAVEDGGTLLALAEDALHLAGLVPQPLDVTTDGLAPLDAAPLILLPGGDPFSLLADLRASGADERLRGAHARGAAIAGQSAGAMVCAPSLTPIRLTSPFEAPDDQSLNGLGLTRMLVLPHHDRAGRAHRHRLAARQHGQTSELCALWDDEVLMVNGPSQSTTEPDTGPWRIARGPLITRPARPADAAAVGAVYQAAARAAWAPFLGAGRLDANPQHPDVWRRRIAAAPGRFLVTEDPHGLLGFVLYGPNGEDPALGEVDLLYTHPRAWGSGVGRRLLDRATWNLLCAGFAEATLWTEHRNQRALAVYQANGWRLDGGERTRDYLGVPLRELRHRLDLATQAGGP